METLFSF